MTAQYGRRTSCSQCPSTYELVPPAETEYSIPREAPKTNDYRKRIYECEHEQHPNIIYWEKHEHVIVSRPYSTEPLRSRQRGGKLEGVEPLTRGSNPLFD